METCSLMNSDQLKAAAERAGLTTVRRFATAAGVSLGTAHKVISGRGGLHEDTLAHLTAFFRQRLAASAAPAAAEGADQR